MDEIALGWTVFWMCAPYLMFLVAFIFFSRWLKRRDDGDTFANDFISFPEDIAKIEAALPKMRGTAL